MSEKKLSLEDAFDLLDQKIDALENPDVSLEQSFNLYKEGMDLLKMCNDSIDEIEKKVMVLEEEGGMHEFQRKS